MSEQDERQVPDARPGDPDLTHRRVLPADETDLTHRRALPAEPQAPEVPAGVPRFDAPAEPGPVAPAPTDPAPTEPAGGPAEQDAGTAPSSSASPAPSGPEPTPAPVQRLMPPTQAIQRSRVAEEFVTHTPGQRNEAQVVDDGRWLAPGEQRRREAADLSAAASNPVEATFAEAAAAQHETTAPQQQPAPQPAPPGRVATAPQGETQLASQPPPEPSQDAPGDAVVPTGAPALPPDAYSPQSTGGLGDLPDQPIVTLPPLAEAIALQSSARPAAAGPAQAAPPGSGQGRPRPGRGLAICPTTKRSSTITRRSTSMSRPSRSRHSRRERWTVA